MINKYSADIIPGRRRGMGMRMGMGMGIGMAMGKSSISNAPTLAYKAVHGKNPQQFIIGMSDAPKKEYKGILVDTGIKKKWLDSINGISDIEVRSTEEGKGPTRLAHVAFRMKRSGDDKYVKKLVKSLNGKSGINAITDIGFEGRPRVMVAGNIWASKDKKSWENWWNTVAQKIRSSLADMKSMKKSAGALSNIIDCIKG